jgi:hypothetical protein
MLRKTVRASAWLACAALAVCCLARGASAQVGAQPAPVRFEKGRTTAVLKGLADNAHGFTYIFAAKAGQKMTVHLTSRGGLAVLSVTEPGGALGGALEVKDWEGELRSTGNYLLAVWNRKKGGRAVPYTLELTLR